ncbi:hypothetical protein [Schlesneria sp.]|uniref:hypothetical protein n=1 Tax=Schlesneria sp. TaxID=2762018 RepID=UPI002F0D39CE
MITSLRGTNELAAVQRRIQNRRVGGRRSRSEIDAETVAAPLEAAPRRKVERRKMIDPTTCERDYTLDEVEFMKAMDEYKRKSGRMFPTWSEVLEVVRSLGYVKKTDSQAEWSN